MLSSSLPPCPASVARSLTDPALSTFTNLKMSTTMFFSLSFDEVMKCFTFLLEASITFSLTTTSKSFVVVFQPSSAVTWPLFTSSVKMFRICFRPFISWPLTQARSCKSSPSFTASKTSSLALKLVSFFITDSWLGPDFSKLTLHSSITTSTRHYFQLR